MAVFVAMSKFVPPVLLVALLIVTVAPWVMPQQQKTFDAGYGSGDQQLPDDPDSNDQTLSCYMCPQCGETISGAEVEIGVSKPLVSGTLNECVDCPYEPCIRCFTFAYDLQGTQHGVVRGCLTASNSVAEIFGPDASTTGCSVGSLHLGISTINGGLCMCNDSNLCNGPTMGTMAVTTPTMDTITSAGDTKSTDTIYIAVTAVTSIVIIVIIVIFTICLLKRKSNIRATVQGDCTSSKVVSEGGDVVPKDKRPPVPLPREELTGGEYLSVHYISPCPPTNESATDACETYEEVNCNEEESDGYLAMNMTTLKEQGSKHDEVQYENNDELPMSVLKLESGELQDGYLYMNVQS